MRSLPLLMLVALAGCTPNATRYPSLLPRPIESQSLAEPAARPAPVATPDAALDARIAEIGTTIDVAAKGFASAAQEAEARVAVARGLSEGAPAWLDAQTALARLAGFREPAVSALADLERLQIERGAAGQPPYPALEAAITRTDTLTNEQNARIAALEAALAGR
jgi:hypothetical protein